MPLRARLPPHSGPYPNCFLPVRASKLVHRWCRTDAVGPHQQDYVSAGEQSWRTQRLRVLLWLLRSTGRRDWRGAETTGVLERISSRCGARLRFRGSGTSRGFGGNRALTNSSRSCCAFVRLFIRGKSATPTEYGAFLGQEETGSPHFATSCAWSIRNALTWPFPESSPRLLQYPHRRRGRCSGIPHSMRATLPQASREQSVADKWSYQWELKLKRRFTSGATAQQKQDEQDWQRNADQPQQNPTDLPRFCAGVMLNPHISIWWLLDGTALPWLETALS